MFRCHQGPFQQQEKDIMNLTLFFLWWEEEEGGIRTITGWFLKYICFYKVHKNKIDEQLPA